MNYKTFIELNERSKKINKSKRMIYIENIQRVNKSDVNTILVVDYNDKEIEQMPEEVYLCEYTNCGLSIPFSFQTLLSSLMTRIISCETWVVNPNLLKKMKFDEIAILPPYTPVEIIYDNDFDKSLVLMVDGAIFGTYCLADLLGRSAKEDIYTRALVNIRSFGFITLPIENKLKSEIEITLKKVRRDVDGVVLGI